MYFAIIFPKKGIMFNVKVSSFFSKLSKKEQKYLKKLINRLNNKEEQELLKSFLNTNSFEEVKEFLQKQPFINYEINAEDFEDSLNSLKEKIAYELNETLLKKLI